MHSEVVNLLSPRRTANLALAFQEMITVIVRLRSGRQMVTDAESYRANVRVVLQKAEQEALTHGYSTEDVRLASFVVVALMDESVLNSRNPVFADWARKPLQQELFGSLLAGEVFFESLNRQLARRDSRELADLLEVYSLCLLLGFRGKYSLSGLEALRGIKDSVAEKIRRIRGPSRSFHPAGLPVDAAPVQRSDSWVRWLTFCLAACVLVVLLLVGGFEFSLRSGVNDIRRIASQSSP